MGKIERFVGNEADAKLVIDCLAIYIGDYAPEKQYAASLLLKTILKEKKYKALMNLVKEELGYKINNRNDASVIRWARRVKKIGRCEVCGAKEKLVAHHRIPWEYSVKGRTDINNGQCLCSDCHKMMHNGIMWVDYKRRCRHGR